MSAIRIPNQRAVLDRRKLAGDIAEAVAEAGAAKARKRVVELLRGAMAEGREELTRRLAEKPSAGHEITWTAWDNFGLRANPINIYLSLDSGNSYSVLASDEANSGAYSWSVPGLDTNEARVRMTAEDECGNVSTFETSDFIVDSTPPSVPGQIYPGNGSATNDAYPAFSWSAATDNLSGIASYEIMIDTAVVAVRSLRVDCRSMLSM